MLYIFLDESGVHKKNGLSCVALVYVDETELSALDYTILQTEKELATGYFHWKDHGWKLREKFLRKMMNCNFQIKIAIIRNPFTEKHYEEVCKHMITEKDAVLVFDGEKPKHYQHKLKKVLRDKGVLLKKLKISKDSAFPLLRLADFCAGVARSYHERTLITSKKVGYFYKIIHPKIIITTTLP